MLPSHLGVHTDERQIILTCRWLQAIDEESARPQRDLNPYHSAAWQALIQKGWIREAQPGLFYLNERIVRRTWSERHPNKTAWGTIAGLLVASFLIHLMLR